MISPRKRQNPSRTSSTRPHKRLKSKHSAVETATTTQFQETPFDPGRLQSTTKVEVRASSSGIVPSELSHLEEKYDFKAMSIISSSKIKQKTHTLLAHLERSGVADTHAKPEVIVLHSKAPAASKMVSIVEIAKREIQKGEGKWWQYSKLHGVEEEVKEKQRKECGKTILDCEEKQAARAEDSIGETGKTKQGTETAKDEVEEDDGFEMMEEKERIPRVPGLGDIEGRKKIRAVPIMTIYMSRIQIPEFKDHFG